MKKTSLNVMISATVALLSFNLFNGSVQAATPENSGVEQHFEEKFSPAKAKTPLYDSSLTEKFFAPKGKAKLPAKKVAKKAVKHSKKHKTSKHKVSKHKSSKRKMLKK